MLTGIQLEDQQDLEHWELVEFLVLLLVLHVLVVAVPLSTFTHKLLQ